MVYYPNNSYFTSDLWDEGMEGVCAKIGFATLHNPPLVYATVYAYKPNLIRNKVIFKCLCSQGNSTSVKRKVFREANRAQ